MLFSKMSDKAIQNYYLSLSAISITVTGWKFFVCNLPLRPQQIYRFFVKNAKIARTSKIFQGFVSIISQVMTCPYKLLKLAPSL